MAFTGGSGPLGSYGSMDSLPSTGSGNALSGAHDVGPSFFYQGLGVPDPRFVFNKEQAGGFMGVMPAQFGALTLMSVDAIPATLGAAMVAAAHTVVSGTAMTLANPSFGAVTNIPVSAIAASGNGFNGTAPTITGLALDFGFAMATLVSGSANVTVQDTTMFTPGMPLIFAAIATTTTPWLTTVLSITSATVMVMATTAPFSAATGGARVGTGNIWQPNEGTYTPPTAAAPYLAKGPGLFFDPRQGVARALSITCNNASGVGGAIIVKSLDIYGQPMTESITITPASALVVYGGRAHKYVLSVTPQFSDPTFTYSIGTADVFGFNTLSTEWENSTASWNSTMVTTATGWTGGPGAATIDARGTLQTGSAGGGTGISGGAASNGSHTGTAFTGRRLMMGQRVSVQDLIYATPNNAIALYGNQV